MDYERLIRMEMVSEEILLERKRQNGIWGIQRHDYGTWLTILVEEVGEVAQAMQAHKGWGKNSDKDDLYKELIQVAAVASAIAEQVLEEQALKKEREREETNEIL